MVIKKLKKIILGEKGIVLSQKEAEFINFEISPTYLFAKTREYTLYYESLKGVKEKRDISLEMSEILEKVLTFAEDAKGISEIESLLSSEVSIDATKLKGSANSEAKRLHPKGYELLEIKESLALDYLKTYYRNACKKYHPDLGGSNEKMKIVNEAYNTFNKLLCEKEFNPEGEIDTNKRNFSTAKKYFSYITSLLFEIYTDIM
ncbi:MAG: DnaJ domain-containing protein, partial [Nanoarchaeota archaeon]